MRYSQQNKKLKNGKNKLHIELISPHNLAYFPLINVISLKSIRFLAIFFIFAEP